MRKREEAGGHRVSSEAINATPTSKTKPSTMPRSMDSCLLRFVMYPSMGDASIRGERRSARLGDASQTLLRADQPPIGGETAEDIDGRLDPVLVRRHRQRTERR
jgi:hypothetical protein